MPYIRVTVSATGKKMDVNTDNIVSIEKSGENAKIRTNAGPYSKILTKETRTEILRKIRRAEKNNS